MGFRQPLSCIILIVPHCFRGGDDTCQTLGAFALRDAKLAGAWFVRSLRHDAIDVSVGFAGCNEDSAHSDAKSKFRQAFPYDFLEFCNGVNGSSTEGPCT